MSIAFLGDSITYGYGLENKNERYSSIVCNVLKRDEENYGITGTLVARAGLNKDNGDAFVTRIGLIDSADVAVIFGGTNDYFWSDKAIVGETDEYFAYALKIMIARIKKYRNDKITLFVTPYRHNGIGNYLGGKNWQSSNRHCTDVKNYNGHTLYDYVSTIEKICAINCVPCLNLYDDFNFNWQIHTLDGCHPNAVGHRLIAEAIINKINSLISKQ